jgi:hypothetical protein
MVGGGSKRVAAFGTKTLNDLAFGNTFTQCVRGKKRQFLEETSRLADKKTVCFFVFKNCLRNFGRQKLFLVKMFTNCNNTCCVF